MEWKRELKQKKETENHQNHPMTDEWLNGLGDDLIFYHYNLF